jgi:hypothetical protein
MNAKTVAHLFFRNLGWKILSLVIATMVWITIHREPVIFSVLPAPVQFKNVPPDLESSSDIVESVDLETRGPAELLRTLSERKVAVVLDFSSVHEPGERTFTLARKDTTLPRGVELVRFIPSQLRFVFERRIVRKVPVEPQVSGTLPRGLRIISTDAHPPEIAITGPESKVRRITSLHTDPVDLNNVSEDKNVRVTAYLPNSQLRFKESPEVIVRITVAK